MPIVTQKISLNLTQSKLPPLIMHTDEQGRRIHFELIDEDGDVITLTDDYSARYSQKKPDGNFVSELLSISEDGKLLTLNQVAQMATVPGISYYDIHVYNGTDIIYSGQGRVVVDDHILDNDTIISVAEVDGLTFPDDFATIPWVEEYVEEHSGSDVIANPDTVPTDTLDTVTISGTTYEIIQPTEIRITAAYDAVSLSNTDVTINYQDYDALVIYVNDALTQCGVSSLFTREYLDYCRANNRTLTFFPFGTAYVAYNILIDKLEYAGDNNQGFYIIRIDGINYRR